MKPVGDYNWWYVSGQKWKLKNQRINAAYDALKAQYERINKERKI
jgi:hypothetical protein